MVGGALLVFFRSKLGVYVWEQNVLLLEDLQIFANPVGDCRFPLDHALPLRCLTLLVDAENAFLKISLAIGANSEAFEYAIKALLMGNGFHVGVVGRSD